MVDRIEIAKKFIQEQIRTRDDIVGAIVIGSVSRGEEVEPSDIDISLIVEGNLEGHQRGGVDAWQDGVYIDAKTVLKGDYEDIEAALQNPFRATHINDGLILYDPTGFFTRMQMELRVVFMQPKWVGMRVQFWLESTRKNMSGLQESVEVRDPLGICENVEGILWGFTSVPLLRLGITPTSTRGLVRLGKASEKLKERICEWEGSSRMNADDVLALLSLILGGVSFMNTSKWGILPTEYIVKKIEWMVKNGQHREALHVLWIGMGVHAVAWRKREEAWIKSKGAELAQRWLKGVGWDGKVALEQKLKMAKALLKEIEALAENIPSAGRPTSI
jgi:predicted nucleotidyltransferase